jgi:hypothetical protein
VGREDAVGREEAEEDVGGREGREGGSEEDSGREEKGKAGEERGLVTGIATSGRVTVAGRRPSSSFLRNCFIPV